MFTGIVEEIGRVLDVSSNKLHISAKNVLDDVKLGDSIAVNGVCLTVTKFDNDSFYVDVMPETLRRTNLGKLSSGNNVNLETALTLTKHLGGHIVQGHVDDVAFVESISNENDAKIIRINAPSNVMEYVVEKGFVAVDGISLTIVDVDDTGFSISMVNFTQSHTTLAQASNGYMCNIEVDIIAKYVKKMTGRSKVDITMDFLRENGF